MKVIMLRNTTVKTPSIGGGFKLVFEGQEVDFEDNAQALELIKKGYAQTIKIKKVVKETPRVELTEEESASVADSLTKDVKDPVIKEKIEEAVEKAEVSLEKAKKKTKKKKAAKKKTTKKKTTKKSK